MTFFFIWAPQAPEGRLVLEKKIDPAQTGFPKGRRNMDLFDPAQFGDLVFTPIYSSGPPAGSAGRAAPARRPGRPQY